MTTDEQLREAYAPLMAERAAATVAEAAAAALRLGHEQGRAAAIAEMDSATLAMIGRPFYRAYLVDEGPAEVDEKMRNLPEGDEAILIIHGTPGDPQKVTLSRPSSQSHEPLPNPEALLLAAQSMTDDGDDPPTTH